MAKSKKKKWEFVLNSPAIVVVQKGGRVQVLKRPKKKKLAKLQRRRWTLRHVTETQAEQTNGAVPDDLRDSLLTTIGKMLEPAAP